MLYLVGLFGGEAQNRTEDTRIFSPLLYRLSYLAPNGADSNQIPRQCQDLFRQIYFDRSGEQPASSLSVPFSGSGGFSIVRNLLESFQDIFEVLLRQPEEEFFRQDLGQFSVIEFSGDSPMCLPAGRAF